MCMIYVIQSSRFQENLCKRDFQAECFKNDFPESMCDKTVDRQIDVILKACKNVINKVNNGRFKWFGDVPTAKVGSIQESREFD